MKTGARTQSTSRNDNRLVMASAGTGKTFQLTGRYIRHALEQVTAENAGGRAELASILATTFTRKAAAEILEKVLTRLCAAVGDPKKLDELREQVHPRLAPEECARLLARMLRELDRLSVVTIDAFFLRIASLFALELGIPPGWGIAEEETDKQLREEAVDAVLKDGDRDELLDLLEMLCRGKARRSVRGAVLKGINGVYDAFLAADGREDAWTVFGPRSQELGARPLASAIRRLTDLEIPRTKTGTPRQRWASANASAVERASSADWDGFLATGLAGRLVSPNEDPPTFDRVEITPDAADGYRPLIEHASAILLARFRDQNLALHGFAARFHAAYQALKLDRGMYRFDDIPRLLLGAALNEQLQHLYFRLDARIRHVLLDEFQDTSIAQFRLLEPMLDELLSAEDGRSVFCVGDIKQSLYGWRSAEPGLMLALPGRWPALRSETLDRSFRSSQVVIDAVNAVFEDLPSNAALAERRHVAEGWSVAFTPHSTALDIPGAARLIVSGPPGDEKPSTTACAADRVKAILKDAPTATVGVLVRTNKHIPRLIYELARREIKASEEGGSPLEDAAPVAVALSMLQLADFPGDTAAAFHVASSPLAKALELPLTASPQRVRAVASLIRARLMGEGYAGVLRWVQTQCASEMDSRGLGRLEQLIDLAQEFEDQAGTRPSDFVRLARERRVEDPGRAQVRVMSIHRAKGLEFDAVVLPDLDRAWKLGNDGFLVDRPDPFGPVVAATMYASESMRSLHPGLTALYERSLDRCVSEEISCLYVAMTRAARCLEMIVRPTDKPDLPLTAAGVLRAALAPDVAVEPDAVLWTSKPRTSWARGLKPPPAPAQPAERLEMTVKPGSGSFVPRRHRASPSSLERGARSVEYVFSTRGEKAARAGTLLHAWFELIEWLDDGVPSDQDLLAAAEELECDAAEARPLIAVFRKALDGPAGAALRRGFHGKRPKADRIEVRREWAFEARVTFSADDGPVELVGHFDRLVLGWRGDKVVWADIVDFKSDNIDAGDRPSVQESVATYRPQLDAYSKATSEMFSVDPTCVASTLLFVRAGLAEPVATHA